MMMMMTMVAYNETRSIIHYTSSDLSSKIFWGPKFELLSLKILTTRNAHMVHIVQF